jgi:hypothetical protein
MPVAAAALEAPDPMMETVRALIRWGNYLE